MTFNPKNREISSDTGYIKTLGTIKDENYAVYDHGIYLGKYDSEDNYKEATQEEYEEYLNKPVNHK